MLLYTNVDFRVGVNILMLVWDIHNPFGSYQNDPFVLRGIGAEILIRPLSASCEHDLVLFFFIHGLHSGHEAGGRAA